MKILKKSKILFELLSFWLEINSRVVFKSFHLLSQIFSAFNSCIENIQNFLVFMTFFAFSDILAFIFGNTKTTCFIKFEGVAEICGFITVDHDDRDIFFGGKLIQVSLKFRAVVTSFGIAFEDSNSSILIHDGLNLFFWISETTDHFRLEKRK